MNYKIIFLSLMIAKNVFALTDAERETIRMQAYEHNLEMNGNSVKVCLELIRQGYVQSQRDKEAVQKMIRLYLTTLASYLTSLKAILAKNKKTQLFFCAFLI